MSGSFFRDPGRRNVADVVDVVDVLYSSSRFVRVASTSNLGVLALRSSAANRIALCTLFALVACDRSDETQHGDFRFVAAPDAVRDVYVSPLFSRVGGVPTSGIETITTAEVEGRPVLRLADRSGTVKRLSMARSPVDSLDVHARFRLTDRSSYRTTLGYLLSLPGNRLLSLSMSWETGDDGVTSTHLLLQKPPPDGRGLQTFSEVALDLPVDKWIPFGFSCDTGGTDIHIADHRVRLDGYPEARGTTACDVALLVRDADFVVDDFTWNGHVLEPTRQLSIARLQLLKHLQARELNPDHAIADRPLAIVKPRLGGEYRDALNAVPPSRYAYEVDVFDRSELAFAIGIEEPEGLRGNRTTVFRVVVADAAGADHDVFVSEPGDTTAVGRWKPVRVDLSPFAGQRVGVRFETETVGETSASNWDLALWGDPRVIRRSTTKRSARPNVLLVSLDTLRPDRLGTYGYTVHPTSPFIDSLAAAGTVFEAAYSHAPQTLLSHMSILTSRPPGLHGVTDRSRALAAGVESLANVFSTNGYRTAAFTGAGFMQGRYGFHHGFHRYFERTDPDSSEFTTQILAHASDWLENEADEPFFLFFHTYEPHVPFTHTRFVPTGHELELPAAYDDSLATAGRYDSGVRYTDDQVRRLFETLRDVGALDHTIVVVLSDHGEELHDRGRGFQGHVDSVHRVVLHVPLIFTGPGVPPGVRVPDDVGLIDVAPTLLALCGLTSPTSFVGTALVPAFHGEPLDVRPILSEGEYSRLHRQSILEGGLHLIHVADFDAASEGQLLPGDLETEFYDVDLDPFERMNVLESRSADAEPLRATLDAYVDVVLRTSRPGGVVDMDDETRRQLRGLGYVN